VTCFVKRQLGADFLATLGLMIFWGDFVTGLTGFGLGDLLTALIPVTRLTLFKAGIGSLGGMKGFGGGGWVALGTAEAGTCRLIGHHGSSAVDVEDCSWRRFKEGGFERTSDKDDALVVGVVVGGGPGDGLRTGSGNDEVAVVVGELVTSGLYHNCQHITSIKMTGKH